MLFVSVIVVIIVIDCVMIIIYVFVVNNFIIIIYIIVSIDIIIIMIKEITEVWVVPAGFVNRNRGWIS